MRACSTAFRAASSSRLGHFEAMGIVTSREIIDVFLGPKDPVHPPGCHGVVSREERMRPRSWCNAWFGGDWQSGATVSKRGQEPINKCEIAPAVTLLTGVAYQEIQLAESEHPRAKKPPSASQPSYLSPENEPQLTSAIIASLGALRRASASISFQPGAQAPTVSIRSTAESSGGVSNNVPPSSSTDQSAVSIDQ